MQVPLNILLTRINVLFAYFHVSVSKIIYVIRFQPAQDISQGITNVILHTRPFSQEEIV